MQQSLLLFACILAVAELFAQQYSLVYYIPKDGLVNSRGRRTKQGSKGHLHFIIYGGLSVYDGARPFSNRHKRSATQ